MSFLPAGAEDSDEDNFDDYYDGGHIDDKLSPLKSSPIVGTSIVCEKPKPKGNSLIQINGSPNGLLLLNDIRMAVINGNLDLLKEMIETETDNQFFVDTVLSAGWTPLMYASNGGHKHIVDYLLERGADPNYHLKNFTPLMALCISSAKEEDLMESARHLIKFGADVNAVDSYGNSPLIYAAKSGKTSLTQLLIDCNADINRSNSEGWNALHLAVREGLGKIVEKLLNNGIDLTLKTNTSQSAADIALSKGHQKIYDILENIRLRNTDDSNELERVESLQNGRLNEEEINALNSYVKPLLEIKCHQKSEKKPKVPNIEELEEFLSITNYEHLLPEFAKHNFGYEDLVTNTEETLRIVGVEDLATIRKISSHIILIHKQDWKRESLKDFNLDTNVSCPDIYQILSNISSHLSRINQTVVFIEKKIRKSPEIMSYSNDITTKDQVLNEVLQNSINTRSLFNDLQSLRNLTHILEDWSEPQKPEVLSIPFTLEDELNINAKKSSKYSKSLVLTLISVGALTLIINYKPINGQNLLKSFIQSIPRPQFQKFNHIF